MSVCLIMLDVMIVDYYNERVFFNVRVCIFIK